MFGAVCKPCSVKDEASTVKVDMSKLEESALAPEAENERREEEARKRREEQEAQRLRQEKERKDAEEQKRRREEEQAAAETQRRETQRREEEERARRQKEQEEEEAERLRQEKEREQAAARERELETERQRAAEEKAKEEAELREQLNAWLKKNSFADANAKKKTMLPPSHCYPLHIAVKQKNAQMVRALVLFGADKNTPNSSGQTALDLATKSNKSNSHDEIIAALR